ncbi:iron ABC transporter permease [Diaphorobacter sp.]|uniref:FecCD family ABC transporter permease n=1 Tax=Diaphorobacter sp. TaxID=1934310 RepID=UPI0028AC404E|nr:iron ABC transporter permease [Diaphorobacter sp.]
MKADIRAVIWKRWRALAASMLAVLLCVLGSLTLGAQPLPLADAIGVLVQPDDSETSLIAHSRVPRTLLAVLAGAALAMAGALVQALTRNPLADPGLLGINAGASCAIVVSAWSVGSLPAFPFWVALPGACLAALLVYSLSQGMGGMQPVRLLLAGAAVNAFLFAGVQAIALLHSDVFDGYRFWAVGSLAGQSMQQVAQAAPAIVGSVLLAAWIARPLNVLMLGDAMAQVLGVRAQAYRLGGLLCMAMLAAGATAAVGPMAFVGLAVPHMVRPLAAADLRWQLAFCALLGPCLLLLADVLARWLRAPAEVLTGVVVALLGGPFLLMALRRQRVL